MSPQSFLQNDTYWTRVAPIRARLLQAEPIRWVFAGDSITHGARHTLGWRDYTELISERVRFEMGRIHDIVIKTGVSGWRISNLAANFAGHMTQFAPGIASLMFGMNDCTLGRENLADFRATYLDLINRLRERTDTLILLHTPNWILPTGGPERLQHLPAYRATIIELAEATGVACIDHFAVWQEAEARGVIHHWMAHGCHPNEFGHRAIAQTIMHALGIWDQQSWTCQLMVPQAV